MDHRLEEARDLILRGVEEITQKGALTSEGLCNMEKLVKSYHYLAEAEMLEDLDAEDYETYERGYGRTEPSQRRTVRRGYVRNYGTDGDMRMYLEDQLRNATTEQERERIRRLMSNA